MEDVIIEQRQILWLSCYKATKFAGDPEKSKCPWSYTRVNEMCKHCRWLTVNKTRIDGRPLITDTELAVVPNGTEYTNLPTDLMSRLPEIYKEPDALMGIEQQEE